VRDNDGATGVLAFRGDGSRHGFTVAVLALQPDGLVQVGSAPSESFYRPNCGAGSCVERARVVSCPRLPSNSVVVLCVSEVVPGTDDHQVFSPAA